MGVMRPDLPNAVCRGRGEGGQEVLPFLGRRGGEAGAARRGRREACYDPSRWARVGAQGMGVGRLREVGAVEGGPGALAHCPMSAVESCPMCCADLPADRSAPPRRRERKRARQRCPCVLARGGNVCVEIGLAKKSPRIENRRAPCNRKSFYTTFDPKRQPKVTLKLF